MSEVSNLGIRPVYIYVKTNKVLVPWHDDDWMPLDFSIKQYWTPEELANQAVLEGFARAKEFHGKRGAIAYEWMKYQTLPNENLFQAANRILSMKIAMGEFQTSYQSIYDRKQ